MGQRYLKNPGKSFSMPSCATRLTCSLLLSLLSLGTSAEAQYVKTSVASFSTASTTFTNVTGGTLTFTPSNSSDIWILLVNARLMSTQIASFTLSAEARYFVNGVEHGIGGILNSAANKGASWQHFYRVTGTTAMQTVQVQLRDDSAATATIADLQVIAFLLPAGADFQYTETEAIQAVPSPWTTYESLSFTPSAPGTYLIMALANGTEDPGTGGIGIRLEDPAATYWPDQSGGNRLQYMSNTRIPWQSYFLARAENLTATPQTYNLQATGDSGSGSQLRYTRLMAFRTDVLDSFETVEDTAITSTTSTTPVVRSVLTTAAPPSARDYIVIQSLVLSGTVSVDENRAGFETDDVVKMSYDHVFNGSFHYTSFGFFDALTSSGAVKYENTFSTSNAASAVEAKESVIHVLRLPLPPTNYRSIGTAPDYTVGTVNATNGSALVTGTGTAWRTANRGKGDWIVIDGGNYTILSVDSEVQLTLTAPFTGITGSYATDIKRHFTTLLAWEACISFAGCPGGYPFAPSSASLVADHRTERGIAYNDSVFTAGATISGSTTDATHNITLTVALGNRHDGTAGTGVVLDGVNTDQGIRVEDDFAVIEWFELTRNRGSLNAAALVVQDASNVLIQQVIIHDFLDLGNFVTGIRAQSNSDYTVRNCIIYDGGRAGIRNNTASSTGLVENCTVYGMVDSGTGTGILHSSGTLTVTNTVSMGNEVDFNGTITQSFNLSSDATASGLGSLTGKAPTLQFVNITPGDEANWDLHLIPGADALDAGTDLSPAFVIDIDAQIRPWGAQWDMGADERPTASSCPVTRQAWFDQDWLFRKAVVVQSSQVTAVLTDFPVLINLASDTELAADAQNDGDDIVFTASDGVTKLSHEIEKFVGATGELVAWVKAPYLSSGADTTIYMYYGNGTVGNQQDVANVWDTNFKGVWHLKEEQAGTGNLNLYTDSSLPAYDGDDFVSATSQNGQIDGGQEFDAADDYIDTGADDPLDITGPLTVSAWVYRRSNSTTHHIASKNASLSNVDPWQLAMLSTTNVLRHHIQQGPGGMGVGWEVFDSTDSVALDQWHHVAVVRNSTQVTFYIDGVRWTPFSGPKWGVAKVEPAELNTSWS